MKIGLTLLPEEAAAMVRIAERTKGLDATERALLNYLAQKGRHHLAMAGTPLDGVKQREKKG